MNINMNNSALQADFSLRQKSFPQAVEIDLLVADALRLVVQDTFVQIASSLVITISARSGKAHNWFCDILEKLFGTWGLMALQLVRVDQRQPVKVPGRRICNLILTDSYLSLLNADVASYNEHYDSSEFYFIFLQAPDHLIHAEAELILNYCWRNHWINCNVMIQTANAEITVYTYFPFGEQHCHQARPVPINSYDGQKWAARLMFPQKLNNMHQCPLKLLTWHVPPFVIVTETQQGAVLLDGLEVIALRILQAQLNFSVEVIVLKGADIRGSIYANGTVTGALGMLAAREADFSMGFFIRSVKRVKVATSIFSHCHAPMMAVIMRDNYKYSSLEMLAFSFEDIVWITLFATLMLLAFSNWVLKRCSVWLRISSTPAFTSSQFHIVNIFFGMPASSNVPYSSQRLFMMSWIVGAFVLRSVYQSLLFYLFRTNMYRTAPDSLDALAAANYKLFGTQSRLNLMLEMPIISSGALPYFALNSSDEMETLSYLEAHSGERVAAITARNFFTHYNPDSGRQLHFHLLARPISMQQLTIYFPKHSYLSDRINDKIILFASSGIITAYVRKYARRLYTYESMNHEETLVQYENLEGLYLIFLALLLISFVVFLCEVMLARVRFHRSKKIIPKKVARFNKKH